MKYSISPFTSHLVITSILLCTCSEADTETYHQRLIAHPWTFSDRIVTDHTASPTSSRIETCEQDNEPHSLADNELIQQHGDRPCVIGEPVQLNGSWELLDDEIIELQVGDFAGLYSILELTRSTLRLYDQQSVSGGWIDTELVFER